MNGFEIEKNGSASFLVYKVPSGEVLSQTAMNMLSGKKIAGFLPMTSVSQGDRMELKYDISGCISAEKVLCHALTKGQVLRLYQSLYYGLMRAERFYLEPGLFVIDSEQLYFDSVTGEPQLVCLPLESRAERVPDLNKLLFRLQTDSGEDMSYINRMSALFDKKDNFSLKEIGELLEELISGVSRDTLRLPTMDLAPPESVKESFHLPELRATAKEAPAKSTQPTITPEKSTPPTRESRPARNFAAEEEFPVDFDSSAKPRPPRPGERRTVKPPKESKQARPEKEKNGFFASLFAASKEKEAERQAKKEQEAAEKAARKQAEIDRKEQEAAEKAARKQAEIDRKEQEAAEKAARKQAEQTKKEQEAAAKTAQKQNTSRPRIPGEREYKGEAIPAQEQEEENGFIPVDTARQKIVCPEEKSVNDTSYRCITIEEPQEQPARLVFAADEDATQLADSDATQLADDDTCLVDEDATQLAKRQPVEAYLVRSATGEKIAVRKSCFVLGRKGQPKKRPDGSIEMPADYTFETSDKGVSRRHVAILFAEDEFYIGDIGAFANWVSVDGVVIESCADTKIEQLPLVFSRAYPLHSGAVVQIRSEKFMFLVKE